MTFQLVRADEDSIAVWHTDFGHIYVFAITPDRRGLRPITARTAPDATEPAERFADEALCFATEEARVRQLVSTPVKTKHAG